MSSLTITSAKLARVPPSINRIPALREIVIVLTKIRYIDLTVFCDHSLLVVLNLIENRIQYLTNTATKRCSVYDSLEVLMLSKNLLTVVNFEMFGVFTAVRHLAFRGNKLTNFTIESLAGMDELRKLDLSLNNLTSVTLNSDLFPKNLDSIDISDNNLTGLDLSYIPVQSLKLYLERNKIERIDINSLSCNITALTMTYNPIDCSFETPLERKMQQEKCVVNNTQGMVDD
ncbi:uncharacterized protein LOC126561084 [Anopheles maculipalpis]|uniref:uncharacterized protein LOC126561084 n=1 Tax=Anopheles maculipalpis TaxID=1496333 RepID=UPI002159027D|nr:uncharacterized protein LOC126561084 [Anopheles maculipalpis]